jgi:iron complex outermembrane receptor protein
MAIRMRTACLLAGLVVAFCLAAVLPVWAADEEGTVLPDVTVSARGLNESLTEPPVFVEVIEMDRFAGRLVSTEDVLRQAAGVSVRNFGGLGAYATVSIRGSSSDQVVVLVDGVRLNEATGGGVDLGSIPPEQIKRIEIIRGGDTAFFGEGAVGGVVNIVTRDGAGGRRTQVATAYGSFNTFRLSASHADGGDQWRAYVGGSLFHTDGNFTFRNDNGTTLDESDDFEDTRVNNEVDARNLLVRGGYSPNATIDLAVQNDLYSADSGVPGLTTFPSPNAHKKLWRDLAAISLALTGLGVPDLSATTRLSNRYEWSRFRDGEGEQTGVPIVDTRVEYEPGVEQSFTYAIGRYQLLTVAGNYRRTQLVDAAFDDPSRDAGAIWFSGQTTPFGEIFTILGTARYDLVSDVANRASGKLGLALKPWKPLTLKANAGNSFRAPNFAELYFNQGLVVGNPDLEPEDAIHYDAGLQFAWSPWVFFEGAYFRSEVRNLIEYLLISGFRYKPFNVGEARLEGMELTLRATPIEYVSLAGAYTLTYALDLSDSPNRSENQIPGRPRHVGFGRLEGRAGPAQPFVEFNYVGGNYITPANTKLLPERKLWNAGIIVDSGAGSRVGFEVKNLTDEQVVDVRGFPLPGRAFYGSFEVAF